MLKRILPAICALALSGAVANAGEATGTFSSGTASFSPKAAAAIEIRDTSDPGKRAIAIVLTEQSVDIAAAAAALDPYQALINIPELMERSHITVFVRKDGVVSYNAQLAGDATQYVDSTRLGLKAEVAGGGDAPLKARVHTPPDTDATPIDVTFSTRVTRMPDGTPIEGGGGDAGKALVELVRAIKAKDHTSITRLVAADLLSGMTADYRSAEENAEAVLDTLGMWLPETIDIRGGRRIGDEAILDARGPMFGMQQLFAIRMKSAGGHWVMSETARLGPAP